MENIINSYETLFITDLSNGEEATKATVNKFTGLIGSNGEIVEGKVSSWTDFEDGDQIQVKINGKSYLVHSSNIVLISD